jgi:Double zinc ribbon
MKETKEDIHITKLEVALIVGIIGCLLLATWEVGNLMVTEWFDNWVGRNEFTNKRIILYGIAFLFSIVSVIISIRTINKTSRFIFALNRALLWYGSLLLITTISIFVFDCLPEVAAGIIGAILFAVAIYLLQRKFFTKERTINSRIRSGQCIECGHSIHRNDSFCSSCGFKLEKNCSNCNEHNQIHDKFCKKCGHNFK